MAAKFPSAVISGLDLFPTQPKHPNFCSEIYDVNIVPWDYENDHFEFIHIREYSLSARPLEFWKEAKRCLVPGGFIEIDEVCFVYNENFHKAWASYAETCSNTTLAASRSRERLENEGLSVLGERRHSVSDSEIKNEFCKALDIEGMILLHLQKLGKPDNEIGILTARMRSELNPKENAVGVTA